MATVAGTKRLLDISGNNISTAVSLEAEGTLVDSSGDSGIPGQILSSTGSGINWITNAAGDITGVTAGTGLSGGGTSGTVTLTNAAPNISTNLTTSTTATTLTVNSSDGTNALLPAATTTVAGVMTGADKTKLNGIATGATNVTDNNQIANGAGYTTNAGDITGVTAGTGMTGGGTSGTVTLNVIGGTGITANANDIAVDATVVRTTGNQTIAGVKAFSDDIRFNNDILDSAGSAGTVGQVLVATQQGAVSWATQSNSFITAATFSTSTGVITGTGGGSAGFTVDIDGRYPIGNTANQPFFLDLEQNTVGTTYGDGVAATPSYYFGQRAGDNDGMRFYAESAATNDVTAVWEIIDDVETGLSWLFRNKKTYSPYTATEAMKIDGDGDVTIGKDLTITGGDIILSGTGRIQGVDTVTTATDAASKGYVDAAVGGIPVGDITAVTAGTGMTGGGTTGAVTLNVIGGTGITANANDIAIDATVVTLTGSQALTNKTGSNSQWTNDEGYTTSTGTTTPDNTQTFTNKSGSNSQWTNDAGYTTNAGDITSVVAGNGLTGGGTSGAVTLNVVGGTGITANANDIAIDATVATLAGTQTFTNKSGSNSQWTNDAGYTTNTGDITSVAAGTGLTGGGTSGAVTLNVANNTYTPFNDIRSLGVPAFTGGANPNITTAQVMAEIEYDGGFDSYSSVFKTSWSYAGNYNLTDAGDFTETAGSSWITWTDNSSDTTRGNITTLAIAPNTGGSAGGVFIYNDQGSSYAPGWRQVWTSMTDGAGSGLDADKLDGQEGAYYYPASNPSGYTTNTGTTTPSSTETFTNKSGSNSQWTNDAGYTTNTGDITSVTAGTNLNGGGTSGAVTLNLDANISLDEVNIGSGIELKESADRADLLQITSATSTWAGIQIRNSSDEGRWSFMTDGSTAGFYDDQQNEWAVQMVEDNAVKLYYNNSIKFTTKSTGVDVLGNIGLNENIFHNGDSNTYIGFPSASNFRVVTAGVERMKVSSSAVTISSLVPTKLVLNNTKDGTWTSGEALGLIDFYGNDASGGGAKIQSSIEVLAHDQYGAHFNMTFNLSNGSSGNSEKMRITGEGRIGIGTTAPLATLNVDNPQTANGSIGFISDAAAGGTGTRNMQINLPNYGEGIRFIRTGTYNGGAMKFYSNTSQVGSVQINSSSTSYNTTSDYRAKENVVPMENSINRLKELKPCRFNFIIEPENTVDGFIAHEAQEVVPEAVTGEKDELDYEGNPEYQGIDQSKIVPLLTSALQEAISKIEQLETRIQALER